MQTNKYLDALNEYAEAKCMTKGDKPGPKDPRRTPAPKKDQKKVARKISLIVPKMIKVRLHLVQRLLIS